MHRRVFLASLFPALYGISHAHRFLSSEYPTDLLMAMGRLPLSGLQGAYLTQLLPEPYEAFAKLKAAANKEGVYPQVISGHRDFNLQNDVWRQKYNRERPKYSNDWDTLQFMTQYSAIPGTSRHHWATDADITDAYRASPPDPLNPTHFQAGGMFAKFYTWMQNHACEYGFYETYTKNTQRTGYKWEPWHYSYRPLALQRIQALLDHRDKICEIIVGSGVKASNVMTYDFLQYYIDTYILGIHPELLP